LGCFVLLLFAVVAWDTAVPDTRQSKCYNATVEIPCPSPGQLFYGQDTNFWMNGAGESMIPFASLKMAVLKDNARIVDISKCVTNTRQRCATTYAE
jgi:hypothetical protein